MAQHPIPSLPKGDQQSHPEGHLLRHSYLNPRQWKPAALSLGAFYFK